MAGCVVEEKRGWAAAVVEVIGLRCSEQVSFTRLTFGTSDYVSGLTLCALLFNVESHYFVLLQASKLQGGLLAGSCA